MNRRSFLKLAGLGAAASVAGSALWLAVPRRQGGALQLSSRVIRLQLRHPFKTSAFTTEFKDVLIVSIAQDGVVGQGEASDTLPDDSIEGAQRFLLLAGPLLRHADLREEHAALSARLLALTPGDPCAKAALDMALLDWAAKRKGLPLCEFLALDRARTPVTSFGIGIDRPELVRRKVEEARAYPLLKIKVGYPGDEEMIRAVRAVTDRPLRVDANGGWKSKEEAVAKISWLAGQGVELVEQPLPPALDRDIAWLRERVRLPLLADESVVSAASLPALAARGYDGVNLKLMKFGGPREVLRLIELARRHRLKVMLGCEIESSLGITAAAHLSPAADYADLDGNLLITNDPFPSGVQVREGKLVLPSAPGIL